MHPKHAEFVLPRDVNGQYNLPAGSIVTAGDTILPSQHNPPLQDIAQAVTSSLDRSGRGGMLAALNFGGFKGTNIAEGSLPTDAANIGQAGYRAVSINSKGASPGGSASVNTSAMLSAIGTLPVYGGTVIIGEPGDYAVTAASIPSTKRVRFEMPQGATVNGTQLPEIPGEWVSSARTVLFVNTGEADSFQYGLNYGLLLQAGALGNFEAAHLECNAREFGTAGKFYVGLNAHGETNSFGNVFGGNCYARSGPLAGLATEIVGAELDTEVQGAVVNRKVGLQVADVNNSLGYGAVFDMAILVTTLGPAIGYRDGLVYGDGTDAAFPLYGTAALLKASVSSTAVQIGYGFYPGRLTFSQAAVQLQSQRAGHRIAWGASDNVGAGAGEIRSDCVVNDGGKFLFTSGGAAVQNSLGLNAIQITADATNPITVFIGGVSRILERGAPGSGGLGYSMVRVLD